jgi:hypothetical protein
MWDYGFTEDSLSYHLQSTVIIQDGRMGQLLNIWEDIGEAPPHALSSSHTSIECEHHLSQVSKGLLWSNQILHFIFQTQ